MTKLAGSLQHISGDRWRYRVFVGTRPDGSQMTRSKSFRAPDRKTALRRAVPIAAALEAERENVRQAAGTITELAERWLALKRQQQRSPSTLAGYEAIAARIVKRFGRRRVEDVRGRDIDHWYGELLEQVDPKTKRTMSPSTVQHHHAVLRAMLRQAERWDQVVKVATRQASPPSVNRHELKPPTDAVLALLMADAGAGDFANAVRILAGTGLRRGELCGLAWSDLVGDQLTVRRSVLEVKGGGIHVKGTKGRKPRTLTVGADVLAAFASQREHLESLAAVMGVPLPADGPVFADLRADPKGGTPRRPGWLSHQWIELRDRHGVDFRLHDLRHWNATFMLNNGVPAATASTRLGHSKTSVTLDIYGHTVPGADRSAAELLSGARHDSATVRP